jgi:hypothetical protein
MSTAARRWRLAGLLALAAALATGCNLPSLIYFLSPHGDPRDPPTLMALEPADKEKEPRVVILAYSGIETRPEFITADRDLTTLLTQELQQYFKENQKRLKIVPAAKVQDYKSNHPDWQTDLAQVGKHFGADYVIFLEIGSLGMYETGNDFYHGRAEIEVSVLNMRKMDESPNPVPLSCDYPRPNEPSPVSDMPPRVFYMQFMKYVAQRVSWCFLPHEMKNDMN